MTAVFISFTEFENFVKKKKNRQNALLCPESNLDCLCCKMILSLSNISFNGS